MKNRFGQSPFGCLAMKIVFKYSGRMPFWDGFFNSDYCYGSLVDKKSPYNRVLELLSRDGYFEDENVNPSALHSDFDDESN
jgi:hypothetical protein